MNKILLIGITCFSALCSTAQTKSPFQWIPLEGNPVLQTEKDASNTKQARNSINCSTTTISLPFFDDFANHDQFYPSCSRWIDKNAYVNQSMAYNPPTIGVVTLDGLNEKGYPYNKAINPNLSSPADTLTSQFIDLSSNSLSDAIVLSFYYQQQGLADRPEEGDSLIVEFKDTSSRWIRVYEMQGVDSRLSANTLIDFEQVFIPVEDSAFLHSSFQFRFRNLASICGNHDHWHLDYIYMAANRVDTSAVSPDVAFSHPPNFFTRYTAIPWRHFDSSMWKDTVLLGTRNYSLATGALNLKYSVTDLDLSGVNPRPLLLVDSLPVIPFYAPSPTADDQNQRTAVADNYQAFNPSTATVLECSYLIQNPISFQTGGAYFKNDTAKRQVVLDNYFAYDDGTAELRIIAQNTGTQIAVEYETTVADTLRGIFFHLPHHSNRNAEELDFINIKVWIDSLSETTEAYRKDIFRLKYVDAFNGYYYVELTDFLGAKTPIHLKARQKFYVGWQQASTNHVPIGYDRSTDSRDKIWLDVGANSWANASLDLQGSIMIRPLLSLSSSYNLIVEVDEAIEDLAKPSLRLYPNPSTCNLHVDLLNADYASNYKIQITNLRGQVVLYQSYAQHIEVQDWARGIYFLTVEDEYGHQIARETFVKQ